MEHQIKSLSERPDLICRLVKSCHMSRIYLAQGPHVPIYGAVRRDRCLFMTCQFVGASAQRNKHFAGTLVRSPSIANRGIAAVLREW